MWEVLAAIAVPLVKIIFQNIAGKELSDREFTEWVVAHGKRRKMAGDSALAWKKARAQAKEELRLELERDQSSS